MTSASSQGGTTAETVYSAWFIVLGALLMSVTSLTSVAGSGGVKSVALITVLLTGLLGMACAVTLLLPGVRDAYAGYPRRALVAGAAFIVWLLVAALLSDRGVAAFLGEPYNQLGWLVLVALCAIAFASIGAAPTVASVLRKCAPWFLVAQYLWVAAGSHGGTLGHSTNLGIAVLLLMPWVIPVGDESKLETRARWLVVAVGLLVMAVIAARVALAVGLVWLSAHAFRHIKAGKAVKLLFVCLLVLSAVVTMLLFRPGAVLEVLDEGSLGGRPQMIELTAESLADAPLVGYGPDGFVSGAARLSTVSRAAEGAALVRWVDIKDPHNALAWVMVSGGMIGALLFLWFVTEVVVVWRKPLLGPERGPAVAATVMAFTVFLSSPASFQLLPLFVVMLGVSLRMSGTDAAQRMERWRPAAAVTFVLASLVLVCLSGARLAVIRPAISLTTAERATGLASTIKYDAELWHEASIAWGTVFNETGDPGAVERDVEAAREAARVDVRNPYHALEYARVLAYYGRAPSDVVAAFDETLKRMPFFPVASAEYAAFLARTGELDAADEQLELARRALEFWGSDTPSATRQAIRDAEEVVASAR